MISEGFSEKSAINLKDNIKNLEGTIENVKGRVAIEEGKEVGVWRAIGKVEGEMGFIKKELERLGTGEIKGYRP